MLGRIAITCGIVGVLYVLALSVQHAFTPTVTAGAPLSPKQVDDCSDDCEQRSIVERWPDGELQRCRAMCRGKGTPGGAPKHEVPSKITVAPTPPAAPPPIAPRPAQVK